MSGILNSEQWTKRHEEIAGTPAVIKKMLGYKDDGGEIVYYFLVVQGNDELGYMASLDEYFSTNSRMEYYRTVFSSDIHELKSIAYATLLEDSIRRTLADGFTMDTTF